MSSKIGISILGTIILLCCFAPALQADPADSTYPGDSIPNDSIPNDSIPNDSIPQDSLPPGSVVSFESRVLSVDYDQGTLTFMSVPWIGKTVPTTRFHGEIADSLGLRAFVPDQLVLVTGRTATYDTLVIDSMAAMDFLPQDTVYAPQQLVIKVFPGESFENVFADPFQTLVDSIPELGIYLLYNSASFAALDSLALLYLNDPAVEEVDPNYLVSAPEGVQSSQPFIDLNARGDFDGQISVEQTHLSEARVMSTGALARVGIIDGGIDRNHSLFSDETIYGYDYIDDDLTPDDVAGGPGSGHGTFIAGLVKLVAPDAELRVYRVLDSTGRGNGFAVAKAIVQAIKDSCRVLNLSMVMARQHLAVREAIGYAWLANTLVVGAAGNDSADYPVYPAADTKVLAVAAVDSLSHKAFFSNYGSYIDICAPGDWIYAPYPADRYAWWNGTSFAAPFVTGQIALLCEAFPQATTADLVRAVTLTAQPIDALNPGFEGLLGYGLIDLQASLADFPRYPCGDINGSGFGPDLADLAMLVAYLIDGGFQLPYPELANLNRSPDQKIDLSDLSTLIAFLTGAGELPRCQ